MKNLVKAGLIFMMLTSTSAWAIGSMQCSNAEGTITRIEKEIWGANPVQWFINGVEFEEQSVVVDPGSVKQLSLEISVDELGEKRVETNVMKVTFSTQTGGIASDFVICKTVEYPNVID